jgi:hypothetical protein
MRAVVAVARLKTLVWAVLAVQVAVELVVYQITPYKITDLTL